MKRLTILLFALLFGFASFGQKVITAGELLGPELVTSFVNSVANPFETLVTSGNAITSAINTAANGSAYCALTGTTILTGERYRITYDFVQNSGSTPNLVIVADGDAIAGTKSNFIDPTTGSFSQVFTISSGQVDPDLCIWDNANTDFSFINISLRKILSEADSYVLTMYDRNQPLNISETCEFWFDGWDASTFTLDGTSVDQWNDKSGNGRHVKNTNNDATRPTYNATTGRVTFTAANSTFLKIDEFAGAGLTQPNTIFIVAKLTGALDANAAFYTGKGTGQRNQLYTTTAASGTYFILAGTALSIGAADADDNIHATEFNGASSKHWINGSLAGSGNAGVSNLDGFQLGALVWGATYFADIEIMEVIGYNATLTEADRDKITGYLSDRWGIAATTGHEGYILTDQ